MGISEQLNLILNNPLIEIIANTFKKFKSSKSYWSISYVILLFTIREAIAWKFGNAINTFCTTAAINSDYPTLWESIGFIFSSGGSLTLVLLGTFIFIIVSFVSLSKIFFEFYNSNDIINTLSKEINRLDELNSETEKKEILEEKKEFYDELKLNSTYSKAFINKVAPHIIQPYDHILHSITTLKRHNLFFYILLFALSAIFIDISINLVDYRENIWEYFNKSDEKISFGTILGMILYHATPILFITSIGIYFISQINKNLRIIENLNEKRQFIKVLESTLYTKAEIGFTESEILHEIKIFNQDLYDKTLNEMFEKKKPTIIQEDKTTYQERLLKKVLRA